MYEHICPICGHKSGTPADKDEHIATHVHKPRHSAGPNLADIMTNAQLQSLGRAAVEAGLLTQRVTQAPVGEHDAALEAAHDAVTHLWHRVHHAILEAAQLADAVEGRR